MSSTSLGRSQRQSLCHLQPLWQACGLPEGQDLLSLSARFSRWKGQHCRLSFLLPIPPPTQGAQGGPHPTLSSGAQASQAPRFLRAGGRGRQSRPVGPEGPHWPPQVASVTCQGPLGKGTSSALPRPLSPGPGPHLRGGSCCRVRPRGGQKGYSYWWGWGRVSHRGLS